MAETMKHMMEQTIRQEALLSAGCHVVVGVSGGADSTALLLGLIELAEQFSITVSALHVHHGIRGEEAQRDQAFVAHLCAQLAVPCRIVYCDVPKLAKQMGMTWEEAGRMVRHDSLKKEAAKYAQGYVALAHHREDQAETVIFRLCRGTGIRGLTAMRPKRGIVIRPLLYCTRAQIEAFLAERGQSYCTDSTNEEEQYTRNRIRRQVLPLLEQIHPQAIRHIAQAADHLAQENDFLEQLAREALVRLKKEINPGISLQQEVLGKMHPALCRRVLQLALREVGADGENFGAVHWEKLLAFIQASTGKTLDLPGGFTARTSYGQLVLERARTMMEDYCYPLREGELLYVPEAGLSILVERGPKKNRGFFLNPYTNCLECDKIGNGFVIRNRRPGDYVFLLGGRRKKLKDYFMDEKIPRPQRQQMALLAEGSRVAAVLPDRAFCSPLAQQRFYLYVWEDPHEGNN